MRSKGNKCALLKLKNAEQQIATNLDNIVIKSVTRQEAAGLHKQLLTVNLHLKT